MIWIFQPTLPARGATVRLPRLLDKNLRISTHAPRTGSDPLTNVAISCGSISTHAPRTGSDPWWEEATVSKMISTHAPRTGSDLSQGSLSTNFDNFNPRSPHGERQLKAHGGQGGCYFNPRSPHGERP